MLISRVYKHHLGIQQQYPTISGYIDRDPDVYSAIESDVMMSHDFREGWEGSPLSHAVFYIVFRHRGGFKYFLFSPCFTLFGADFHFDLHFSDGLKPSIRFVLSYRSFVFDLYTCLFRDSF